MNLNLSKNFTKSVINIKWFQEKVKLNGLKRVLEYRLTTRKNLECSIYYMMKMYNYIFFKT